MSDRAGLAIDNLSIAFDHGRLEVVSGLSLRVGAGEALGLVGESGSGKSLTVRAILRLPPDNATVKGRISFAGTSLSDLPDREMQRLRGSGIAMIFQDPMSSLNPVLRVGDAIAQVVLSHTSASRAAAKARAVDLMKRVGIRDAAARASSYPHEFSGGMRQRVMIAMALAASPRMLLADEPTTALDVVVQKEILMLLMDLQEEMGNTIILVSHDMGVHYQVTQRMLIMYAAKAVEYGDSESVFREPLHPYTRLLISSLPTIGDDRARQGIPGRPPSLWGELKACRFADRCPLATDRCRTEEPLLVEHRPGQFAACHYAGAPVPETRVVQ
jgi:peptide/nickel transport system ATP-binding protein